MKTLALVPYRMGSKGLPGKNVRLWRGRPLWVEALSIGRQTCEQALITTDDPDTEGGGVIHRPSWLAQDDTPMLPVVQHALESIAWQVSQPDAIVLLQPTQPFRTVAHVEAALRMLEETGADSVVSVVQIPATHSPEYALTLWKGKLTPYDDECGRTMDDMPTKRQSALEAYTRDGTVYAIRRETIESGSLYGNDCRALIIPSDESVTLDTEEDWQRAEFLLQQRAKSG